MSINKKLNDDRLLYCWTFLILIAKKMLKIGFILDNKCSVYENRVSTGIYTHRLKSNNLLWKRVEESNDGVVCWSWIAYNHQERKIASLV